MSPTTNRDVTEQVRNGVTYEDFFYRIHIIPIQFPALQERKEDITTLVEHFIEKFGISQGLAPLTPQIMEALKAHDWPGNVRELQYTVYRYLTLKRLDFACTGMRPTLETQDPPLPETADGSLDAMVQQYAKRLILRTLQHHCYQRERTADALGIHR
jgi:DNA-binding NtrC family response regulator